ncbi:MAG: hypothetical protein FWE28_07660 [Oscillospiraceae bacterium]|nr:hypothetical protein [Oscillospiraceae bacterium]
MVRSLLARLWRDRCDIWVQDSIVCPVTGRTVFEERKLHADLPCRVSFRLSFETVSGVRDVGDAAASAGQAVKLFLQPDIVVPAGSKIVVQRQGHELVFARTGMPAIFDGHQEVRMERFERWI